MKHIYIIVSVLLSLLFAAGAVSAYGQTDAKAEAKARKQQLREEKQARREEQRRLEREVGQYRHLRDSAGMAFARTHQPASILSPFNTEFTVSNVICGGDEQTGMIILYFTITPRTRGVLPILIGGAHSGTKIISSGGVHSSSNLYGKYYEMTPGISQEIALTFYNIPTTDKMLPRIDIGVGYHDNVMNTIVMQRVPVFWTASNSAIRTFVREKERAKREQQKGN